MFIEVEIKDKLMILTMSTSSGDAFVSFCQPLNENLLNDFHAIPELCPCEINSSQQIQDLDAQFCTNRTCARKPNKADREKLRREKLNEQFAELAAVLDPDRPKNDKASILVESAQVVKELRVELKRLQAEHASLLDESRELTEEKNELREEKATLKRETDLLQDQFQQHFRSVSPWMIMDPAILMSAASFPYPLAVPQAAPVPPSNSQQAFTPSQAQRPIMAPSPYVPLATIGAFPLHPGLHAYATFGNRHGDGSGSYLPFPNYAPPLTGHSHVERPYAQYPSQLHPLPPYVAPMQQNQCSEAPVSSSGSGAQICRPCAANALSSPVQTQAQCSPVSLPNVQAEKSGEHVVAPLHDAVAENMGSSGTEVNCSSEDLPNDVNQKLSPALPSCPAEISCEYDAQNNQNANSESQHADMKQETKITVEQGYMAQANEVASQGTTSEAGLDKVKQDSENAIQ